MAHVPAWSFVDKTSGETVQAGGYDVELKVCGVYGGVYANEVQHKNTDPHKRAAT